MQLGMEGRCEPCPRGTYRTQGVQAACQTCPQGRTTSRVGGASIEECSLPVCTPGTYLNGTQNLCLPCKKGYYQPSSQQTTCLPCPPNTSTKNVSAISESECTNPCESHGPGMHCHRNAHCLLIQETSDFRCECKPGFGGNGTVCTGELNLFGKNLIPNDTLVCIATSQILLIFFFFWTHFSFK